MLYFINFMIFNGLSQAIPIRELGAVKTNVIQSESFYFMLGGTGLI